MTPSRTQTQTRRVYQFERERGLLGKLDGTIRADGGRYWVRMEKSPGNFAPPVPLPLGRGASLPARVNLPLEVSYDETGQKVIIGVDVSTLQRQGINPALINPAEYGAVNQERIIDLLCRKNPHAFYSAIVLPGVAILGTTAIQYTGGSISLTSSKPSAGNHRYAGVYLQTGGTLAVATSTSQSTGTPLDTTDLQEVINGIAAGNMPLRAFVLNGDDEEFDDENSIDLRNLFNIIPSTSSGIAIFPTRAALFADEFRVVAGNAFTRNVDSGQPYAFYMQQNTPANSDSFSSTFMLKAGTYTMSVLGIEDTNRGKIDWAIDGTTVISAQDWYNGGGTTKNVVKSASVTVSGSGRHKLQGTINGKNASSSDYFMLLTKVWLVPSSDTSET